MNSSKKLIGGGVFVAAVVILAVGDYYIKTRQPVGLACMAEAKVCPDGSTVEKGGPKCEFAACPVATTKSEVENPQSSIPADWKTYKNEKVGIELKYPQNFDLYQESVGQFELIIHLDFLAKGASFDKSRGEGQHIVLTVAEQQIAGSPQELIDQRTKYKDPTTGREYLLKEKKRISSNPLTYELVYGQGEFGVITTIRKSGEWTIWWSINWYKSPEYQAIVEKMLSTLKFTK